MYPPYWVSSKEGTFHITGFLYIFLQNMLGMFAAGAAFWLGKMLL